MTKSIAPKDFLDRFGRRVLSDKNEPGMDGKAGVGSTTETHLGSVAAALSANAGQLDEAQLADVAAWVEMYRKQLQGRGPFDIVPVRVELGPQTKSELDYLVSLHKEHGAPNPYETVEELLAYVASAVADGSRRPGAWERGVLEQMGLVPDSPAAHVYRANYGAPKD